MFLEIGRFWLGKELVLLFLSFFPSFFPFLFFSFVSFVCSSFLFPFFFSLSLRFSFFDIDYYFLLGIAALENPNDTNPVLTDYVATRWFVPFLSLLFFSQSLFPQISPIKLTLLLLSPHKIIIILKKHQNTETNLNKPKQT